MTMAVITTACSGTASRPSAKTLEPAAPVVWSGGADGDGLSSWSRDGGGGVFNSGSGQVSVTNHVARTGTSSFQLTQSAPPTSGARMFRWKEPREFPDGAYYSASYHFPVRLVSPQWMNIMQFKSRADGRNDPFWILGIANRPDGRMFVNLYYWPTEGPRPGGRGRVGYTQQVADVPVGKWTRLEVFLRQSGGFTGQITVWQDGRLLYDENDVQTRYPDGDNEWSVDNYSAGVVPRSSSIEVDDAAISTTALGPAWRPAAGPPAPRH